MSGTDEIDIDIEADGLSEETKGTFRTDAPFGPSNPNVASDMNRFAFGRSLIGSRDRRSSDKGSSGRESGCESGCAIDGSSGCSGICVKGGSWDRPNGWSPLREPRLTDVGVDVGVEGDE